MPFRKGNLPIRYLGIPLASRRIKASDCKVLIDAVKNKINDWRNRSLSFARRLQLISSILSSLQTSGDSACGMYSIGWKEAKVCDLIQNGLWVWPEEWERRFGSVLGVPVPVLNHNIKDKAYWINKKGKEKDFNVGVVWKAIKPELPKTTDVIKAAEILGLPIDRSKYDMDMIHDLCKDMEK
uniref:RNA-directed DNA polymerase, eukaryota, reverse transcriptase zinc-binding domain protein n=1 Tax=Tanacetum cinerariifolium TaxID=118510 RepID=A0A6L2MHG8_TANCI|nr:RNA-directed DNA polymerase, eukaryota, reverse transcriptase zinc-binding domain protein [Tanacetum cinerariifolium]